MDRRVEAGRCRCPQEGSGRAGGNRHRNPWRGGKGAVTPPAPLAEATMYPSGAVATQPGPASRGRGGRRRAAIREVHVILWLLHHGDQWWLPLRHPLPTRHGGTMSRTPKKKPKPPSSCLGGTAAGGLRRRAAPDRRRPRPRRRRRQQGADRPVLEHRRAHQPQDRRRRLGQGTVEALAEYIRQRQPNAGASPPAISGGCGSSTRPTATTQNSHHW